MSWVEQGLNAYFNGRALLESFRGGKDAGNLSRGVSPGATQDANKLSGLGDNAMSYLPGLAQRYQAGQQALTPGFEAYRGALGGLRDGGLYRNYARSAQERASQWGELQKNALAESMMAGSDERIRQARTQARADAMSGLQDVMALNAQQQLAQGQAPGGGQAADTDMQGRYGHVLGQAQNQAGEQERMYGEQVRQALLPQAEVAQAQALQAAHMEADSYKMEALSFVEEGNAALAMLNPYMQTMGQVAGVYANSINSAVGIAQANAAAATTRMNASTQASNALGLAGPAVSGGLHGLYSAFQKSNGMWHAGQGGGFLNGVGNALNAGMGALGGVSNFLNNPLVQMIPGAGQLGGLVNTVGGIGNTVNQGISAGQSAFDWFSNAFGKPKSTPFGGTQGGSGYSSNTSRPTSRKSTSSSRSYTDRQSSNNRSKPSHYNSGGYTPRK